MPLGVIEWALRLACLIIEGIPPEQRRATALVWWSMWWPVGKLWLSEEQRKQVEAIMAYPSWADESSEKEKQ